MANKKRNWFTALLLWASVSTLGVQASQLAIVVRTEGRSTSGSAFSGAGRVAKRIADRARPAAMASRGSSQRARRRWTSDASSAGSVAPGSGASTPPRASAD